MLRPLVYRVLLAAALLMAALPASAREKTDVVILSNGDHLTGEIKGMSRGKLDLLTDDAGRLSIEWDKIRTVSSTHQYEVELRTGVRIMAPSPRRPKASSPSARCRHRRSSPSPTRSRLSPWTRPS